MKQFYNFPKRIKKKKNYFKNAIIGFALLLGAYNHSYAQVNTYSFAQSTGTFSPITGTVLDTAMDNTAAGSLNSNVYPITLPFNFLFNGTSYNSLNISTNGFITFGATVPSTTNTTPISNTATYEGAVSAWGRDINSVFNINSITGNISWETVGTAPNREIVIQWKNFRPAYSISATSAYTFSFQIRLQETSNVIKVVYDSGAFLAGSTGASTTAQIGLRGATNADYNNRLNASTLEFVNSTPGTANSSTQASHTVNAVPGMPTAGLTYTWTPPACYVLSGLTGGATTTNTAAISWTASPSSPGGYDIYYSTSNTPPDASTPPTVSNVPGTSTTLSPLAPSTVYYVWVRANCGAGNTSIWSLQPIQVATQCLPPSILTTTGATVCPGTPATLNATADAGATVRWYDAATNGNLLGTGNSFTTPALASTTNYYASAANVGTANVGKAAIESNASGTGGGLSSYLEFTALSDFTLKTVDLYPYSSTAGTAGTVTIELRTSTGTPITSTTVNVTGYNTPAASTPQTVTLNFPVTGGASYRLGVSSWTGISNMFRDGSNLAYPYTVPGYVNITGTNLSTTYYYFFYNWQISTNCESSRQQVTATVDSNCLSTSEASGKEMLKVYPNPFKDVVTITDIEKVKSVNVLDTSGRTIKMIDNLSSKEIYLGDLKSGLYILNLIMKDGSVTSVKAIKK